MLVMTSLWIKLPKKKSPWFIRLLKLLLQWDIQFYISVHYVKLIIIFSIQYIWKGDTEVCCYSCPPNEFESQSYTVRPWMLMLMMTLDSISAVVGICCLRLIPSSRKEKEYQKEWPKWVQQHNSPYFLRCFIYDNLTQQNKPSRNCIDN
jgi:hypothetical protein